MAPKNAKAPPTTFFGPTKMSLAMLEDMEKRGIVSPGLGRVPPKTEVYTKPRGDEVVVFKDFFSARLRFPLDSAVIDIFARYGVFLHHMTLNSFARVSLFMWLSKTCRIAPNPENFDWGMRVHYQLKTIFVRGSDGKSTEMEPQYGCYTFAFQQTTPSPIGALKNKWPGDWSSFWFYHKVPLDPETKRHPLVVRKLSNLGNTPKVDVARIPANEAYMTVLRGVSKVLSMRDITEEFIACGCFPSERAGPFPPGLLRRGKFMGFRCPTSAKSSDYEKNVSFFLRRQ